MDPIPKSEYFYANKIARVTLQALEEVLGKNGIHAMLHLAHLPHLIENYPADNLKRDFNFADFSAFNLALEEMYGLRGGRGLAVRAGRAAFSNALWDFGVLAGMRDPAYKTLPLEAKLRVGIPAIAKTFSQISDQQCSVKESKNEFVYTIQRCPVCWGRSGADQPVCYMALGLLQEGLKWLSGGYEFSISETRCSAMGHPGCEFGIQKKPITAEPAHDLSTII